MKTGNLLIILGMLLYLITSIVNRFIVVIPDGIYIPAMIIGIIATICGIFLENKKK